MIHIWRPLWEGWMVVRPKWDVIGRREWGVSECPGSPIFIFFLRENWVSAMSRHHTIILLARNLPFDSDFRQWNYPLMILLHCLWTKSNNRTRGQFECYVNFFLFSFDLVHSHARCGCCSIVYVLNFCK